MFLSNEKSLRVIKIVLSILSLILSFGIGYLVGRDWHPAPIIIERNTGNP